MNTKYFIFGSVEFHGTMDKPMLLNVGLVLYDGTVQQMCCTGLTLTATFCDIDAIR